MNIRRLAVAAALPALLIPMVASSADAASPVRISRVQYDSPGPDKGSNASLNAEWVRITNYSPKNRALTGWTLRDKSSHVFRFPSFALKPGASVRVHTGSGSNDRTDLYWHSHWYIWNNTGDKATLKNKAGTTVDTCKWGDGSGTTAC